MKKLPSKKEIENLFNEVNGVLYWKVTNSNRAKQGSNAGFLSKTDGYIYIRMSNKRYAAHRLLWKLYFNEEPNGQIDHIDGNKTNNKKENLRIVTNVENSRNAKMNSKNTSGVTGVSFCKKSNKWFASIRVNYIKKNLGLYKNKEDAIAARKNAEKEFLFHTNHGRKS